MFSVIGVDLMFATDDNSGTQIERMRIKDNTGNVGIGSTVPEAKLEVQSSEGNDSSIALDADDGDDAADTWFIQSTAADNKLRFLNDTNERVTIQSNGNVGIGITAPTSTLHLKSSVSTVLKIDNTDETNKETGIDFMKNGTIKWTIFADNNTPNAGDVNSLKIVATGVGTEDDANPRIQLPSTNNHILMGQSGGNVGIGTTAPAQLLDVAGQIQLDIDTTNDTTIGVCKNTTDGTSTATEFRECNGTPGDIAEWYETKDGVKSGDIVYLTDEIFTYQEELIDPRTGLPMVKEGALADEHGNFKSEDRVMAQRNFSILSQATRETIERAIGIVSTSPYQSFGKGVFVGQNPKPIALIGRVPTNVSLENGPIEAGDFITISSTAGVGMKASAPGRVIGYALEPFTSDRSGIGQIMVFINPHWWGGAEGYKSDDAEDEDIQRRLKLLEDQNALLKAALCREKPDDPVCQF
jgi:hypothetical protein